VLLALHAYHQAICHTTIDTHHITYYDLTPSFIPSVPAPGAIECVAHVIVSIPNCFAALSFASKRTFQLMDDPFLPFHPLSAPLSTPISHPFIISFEIS
jgi:hypothetical protein